MNMYSFIVGSKLFSKPIKSNKGIHNITNPERTTESSKA